MEPPGFEDDEYVDMNEHRPTVLCSSPLASRETQAPPHHLHRHSEPNPGGLPLSEQHHPPLHRLHRRHMKSLSLPTPFCLEGLEYSSSEEEVDGDCNGDDEDDSGGEDDSGDNEDIFYKSLPCSYTFQNLTWTGPDRPNLSPPPSDPFVDRCLNEESGDQSESSEAAMLKAFVTVGPPGNSGKLGKFENEEAVKSQAMKERQDDIESCEENEEQTKLLNQR